MLDYQFIVELECSFKEWYFYEPIYLLQGIKMYGFGNWYEVAEHVGTKDRTQCLDHYNSIYVHSPCVPVQVQELILDRSTFFEFPKILIIHVYSNNLFSCSGKVYRTPFYGPSTNNKRLHQSLFSVSVFFLTY